MINRDINTILLIDRFIVNNNRNSLSHILSKKILHTKIKSSIEKKKSISLSLLMIGFIFVDRFGL